MGPGAGNEFQKRAISLEGIELEVESYRVGSRWGAKVQTAVVGNSLGRGSGNTREAAEDAAIDSAKMVLDMRSAAAAFRTSTNRMRS
jgi:hypothetical protein